MREGTKKLATSVLRFAVIWLGVDSHQLVQGAVIAMPPELVAQSGSAQDSAGYILPSQTQPLSSSISDTESAVSTAGSSTEPQPSTQEAISITLPGSSQNRRRPKMAGIPEGMKAAEQLPESPAEEQQAAPQVSQTNIAETPSGVTATQGAGTQAGTVEAENETSNLEDISPGALAARRAEAQGSGQKYALAPIFWHGRVFDTFIWTRVRYWGNPYYLLGTAGGANSGAVYAVPDTRNGGVSNVKGALLEGDTFILHPWVATVSGHLGVITEDDRYLSSTQRSHDYTLLTGAGVNLLSATRFPFSLLYDSNDSRASNQNIDFSTNNDTKTRKLNITQHYQPLLGPDTYNFGFNYINTSYQYSFSEANSSLLPYGASFAYTNLYGNYLTRYGNENGTGQPIYVNGSHETVSNSLGDNEIRDNISAGTVYVPEEYLLTLSSNANFFQTRSAGIISRNLQIGANGTWQPEALDNPLVVRGSAMYFKSQNTFYTSSSNTQVISAAFNATYNKWSHLTLTGNTSLTDSDSNGVTNLTTTQSGQAVYNPVAWTSPDKRINYSKFFVAGFSNLTSSIGGSDFSSYAGASHSLSSRLSNYGLFGKYFHLSGQVSQSLYLRTDELNGSSQTLTNNGSVTWVPLAMRSRLPRTSISEDGIKARSSGAANLISSVGLYANDTRTYGRFPSHSQSFRLTLGAGAGAGYLGSASGYGAHADASIEYARTNYGESGGLQGNAGWGHKFVYDYRYKKRNIFNVKRLVYLLHFGVDIDPELTASRQLNFLTSQQYANNTKYVDYGVTLGQTLLYRIGFNELMLTAYINDSYGINTASLFLRFRAWRNFGN